jgi:hypothetical protein
MLLTTTVNEKEFQMQLPCLEAINRYSALQNSVICVDFQPELEQFKNTHLHTVSSLSLFVQEDRLPQSGLGVPHLPVTADDPILIVGTDMIMQRPLSGNEVNFLAGIEEDAFYILPEQRWYTLSDDLGHVEREAKIAFYFPEYHQFKKLHTEVMVARRMTWLQLASAYDFHWEYYKEVVYPHDPAWLVSYVLQHDQFDIKHLPPSMWETPLFGISKT